MNVTLTDEMKSFVRKKVESGAFPSEEAVLQEAVRRFRQEDQPGGDFDNGKKSAEEDLIRQIRTLDALQLSVALHIHQITPIDYFGPNRTAFLAVLILRTRVKY